MNDERLIHTRQVKIETFDIGENKLLIRGSLQDDRPLPSSNLQSDSRPSGIVHGLRLDMSISLPDLTIVNVEASMPTVPLVGCTEVLPEFQKLVGLTLTSGFSYRVKRLLGGTQSCIHFVSLILAMGPAAIQGYGATLGARQEPATNQELTALLKRIVNTCRMWAEDGPMARRLMQKIEQTRPR